jgi:hypothetical protein
MRGSDAKRRRGAKRTVLAAQTPSQRRRRVAVRPRIDERADAPRELVDAELPERDRSRPAASAATRRPQNC